jgi:putative SOS response-associated peptidase YedK
MCGRYGRRADKQRIAEMMQAGDTNAFDVDFAPSYNVAPQSIQPVVRLDPDTGQRELAMMRWGLVPFWILLANSISFVFNGDKKYARAPDPLLPKQIKRFIAAY